MHDQTTDPTQNPISEPAAAPSTRRAAARRGDRGEGVISTAIAVLVMAFLGAAMWLTFSNIWGTTAQNTENQVQIIGTDAPAGDTAG